MRRSATLARVLDPLLWDHRGHELTLERDRDFLVRRVLAEGSWTQIRRLRSRLGKESLRSVLTRSRARGLSPARIRFFEIVLDLPARQADAWVRAARAGTWAGRQQA